GVETARPARGGEVLPAAERLPAVEHDRGALEAVAPLVRVARHRGDAGEAEVERRYVVPELLDPRQEEAAEARVDVHPDAVREGHLGEAGEGVDEPVRVVRGRPGEGDRVGRDGGAHRLDVGEE